MTSGERGQLEFTEKYLHYWGVGLTTDYSVDQTTPSAPAKEAARHFS